MKRFLERIFVCASLTVFFVASVISETTFYVDGLHTYKSPPQWKPSSMPAMNKRFESLYEGKELNLDCKAQSQPKPNVKWLKDGVELKNSNNIEVKKFNVILKTLTTDMSGNYTCVVSNKHGQIEWTFHVDVQVKIWPLIIEGPNNITQMVGSNVAFRCHVANDPRASIRWQKTNSNKNTDEHAPQADFLPDGEDLHVLTLNNIQKSDDGEYRCMAGNVWGLKYSSAWLTVIEPVLIPDLQHISEMSKTKNRNKNINNNNVLEPELQEKMDSFEADKDNSMDMDNSLYKGGYDNDGLDPSDYGPDLYFTTSKRPKKGGNNRKKTSRKKDKKGKDRIYLEEDVIITTPVTLFRMQQSTTKDNLFRTAYPDIWVFTDKTNDEVRDTRNNPVKSSTEDSAETEDADESEFEDEEYLEGSISSWTIYTVVGAAGGVILLIGLVAITLTLCCKKEESGVYKTTPV